MATVKQLPTPVNVEVVAGDPFTVTFTGTSGVTTFASPAVAMTTSGGDAYATDPGVPSVSAASAVLTCAWSAADTAALNTTTRGKTYKYSVEATIDGAGPVQLFGGTITVHPVGTAGTSSSSSTSATVNTGGAAVSATITIGAPGAAGPPGSPTTASDTPPSGATTGDMWLDSTTGLFYVYYDSFWVGIGGGAGSAGGVSDIIAGDNISISVNGAGDEYTISASVPSSYAAVLAASFR